MRYEYDREADILMIILQDAEVDHGDQTDNVILHYDADGEPVEIEILDASQMVLELIRPMKTRDSGVAEA